jgi:uncharacterized protein (TIGR02600 family)
MKTSSQFSVFLRKRGIALILVVSVLALLTILMLAMFTATDNEFKSTQGYVASQDAKRMGDIATNIVAAQLRAASVPDPNSTTRYITATQPGCVRSYNTDGSFAGAFKLYSSTTMQIKGAGNEIKMDKDVPPVDWDKPNNIERYVDLNEPIIRAAVNGTSMGTEIYFPIVDPTGYKQDTSATGLGSGQSVNLEASSSTKGQISLEGFSYSTTAPTAGGSGGGGQAIDGIVMPSTSPNANSLAQRLPMPVEWLYILQDGTMGTLAPNTNVFQPAGGGGNSMPTSSNPIVGRIAFWADDESCKVNINTAAEGTFWATPRFYHEREHQFVDKPPVAKEYQRFPGHPATVAMSSVLYPDTPGFNTFDLFGKIGTPAATAIINQMQRLYDIAPKVAGGGSLCGSYVYAIDSESGFTQASSVNIAATINERLYASLDELLFSQQMTGGPGSFRLVNDKYMPSNSGATTLQPIIDGTVYKNPDGSPADLRSVIERSRFFLTANSRAPEFNNLGTPKICMWPIYANLNDSSRVTGYDQLIAFCASLNRSNSNGGNGDAYYFQRQKPHDASFDIGIARNGKLMSYLKSLVSSQMPATGTSGNQTSLNQKYTDDNMNTILVEIFDYIRSTNLYDDILSEKNKPLQATAAPPLASSLSEIQVYTNAPATFYTYTNPLVQNIRTKDPGGNTLSQQMPVADDGWPGHGTVTPSIWNMGGGKYRGMARFPTISEIGLHLICTADGKPDAGSFTVNGVQSGGGTAERIDPNSTNVYKNEGQNNVYGYMPATAANKAYWYSNYPPKPAPQQYGTDITKPLSDPRNPNKHPGYDPTLWNMTLDPNTPLDAQHKRVEALIDFEFFCPAEGFTVMNPEWTLVLDGTYINAITVAGQSVWNTTNNVVIKSNKNVFNTNGAGYRSGGSASPTAIYSNRRVNQLGNFPHDPGYDSSANSAPHAALDNLDLVSKAFTVDRDAQMIVQFPAGSGMLVKLYDTHDWQNATEVQKFHVNFAGSSGTNVAKVPTPYLAKLSTEKRQWTSGGVVHTQRAVDACRWWAFQWGGALQRYKRNGAITVANIGSWGYAVPVTDADVTNLNQRTWGRFHTDGDTTVPANSSIGGLLTYTASNNIIFGIPTNLQALQGGINEQNYGTDVIRTIIPCLGDYRLIASRYEVPVNMWQQHRLWGQTNPDTNLPAYMAHNFTGHDSGDAGFDFALNPNTSNDFPFTPQFVRAYGIQNPLPNMGAKMPDIPQAGTAASGAPLAALEALNSYLDFDNGPSATRDGAYCNKPDEGNFSNLNFVFSNVGEKFFRNGYFYTTYEFETDKVGNGTYFTPNRLIPSPVMFGSLVTGVFNPVAGTAIDPGFKYPPQNAGRPWATLLFRPYVIPCKATSSGTQGSSTQTADQIPPSDHPGSMNPPDHYLLDLFNMPVVEPYAISEPLSTAGKINLNYQIVPFTYIRRATAVYAAMKDELLRVIPLYDNGDPTTINANKTNPAAYMRYKNGATLPSGQTYPPVAFYTEQNLSSVAADNMRFWHRTIDPYETTKQLDERFNFDNGIKSANGTVLVNRQGLLRSASQLCELHMIPYDPPISGTIPAPSTGGTGGMYRVGTGLTSSSREDAMKRFWAVNALTGDNTREEIYAHLYPKFTTKSNTFRVHVRAQALKKARSADVTKFDTTKGDKVLSEYRGSYLLERYIDPNDRTGNNGQGLPDYAGGQPPLTLPSLETFYRFHVLETKRFAP